MERYETLCLIGEGAYGKALLCRDKTTGSHVVVKYMNIASQPEHVQKASLQEAKILRVAEHPNIISYVDSFIEDDIYLCIVMEHAAGGDLHSLIHRPGQTHFPETQIIQWMREIIDGIDYIHSIHILHRDIKPKNIFLDASNHIKIGDFGISKILENTGDLANTIVGSPFYLSPELCQGKPYDSKSDVWAIGCVLYELCTLKCAFDGSNMGAIVLKIMNDNPPPIPKFYSPALSKLVNSMLCKDPNRRPTISDIKACPLFEFEDALEQIVSSKPKKSKPRKRKSDGPIKVTSLIPEPANDPVRKAPSARPVSSMKPKKKKKPSDKLKLGKFFIVTSLEK